MTRMYRRSGISLIIVGLLGVAFFWLTDPRWGYGLRWDRGGNPMDLANQYLPGTLIGAIGSLVILSVGIYLMRRKAF